jgi:Zn-finger nucleic acid-binding protein
MADRHGIEIDYCPNCRGVWLDRGELDKIIERAAADMSAPASAPPPPVSTSDWQQKVHKEYDKHKHYPSHGGHYYGKRKKSLLSELFDFD